MIGRALVVGAGLVAVPAAAQQAAPLAMTCHLMIGGLPSPRVTTFTLSGNTLFSDAGGERRRISTAGTPLFLDRSTDKDGVTLSYASHVRDGTTVRRNVYWKTGSKPRYLRFSETYDFKRQTITTTGEPGDSCHHDGR